MSKIIPAFVATALLFANCNNENDNNPVAPATRSPEFNPPVWILGTWGDPYDVMKFEFHPDDVIMVSLAVGVTVDFKKGFSGATVTEDVNTEIEYRISATYPNMKQAYRFVKKSPATLDYYQTMTDDAHPDTPDQSPVSLIKE